jgi:transposase
LLPQKRERGNIAPPTHGGGTPAKLNEDQLMIMSDLGAKTPETLLGELREPMKKRNISSP